MSMIEFELSSGLEYHHMMLMTVCINLVISVWWIVEKEGSWSQLGWDPSKLLMHIQTEHID